MGKASNWAKFIATSSIGVIHQGHVEESIRILQPYLPQTPASNSPFSEGGALYALGLIHANKAQLSTSAAVSPDGGSVLEFGFARLGGGGARAADCDFACLLKRHAPEKRAGRLVYLAELGLC